MACSKQSRRLLIVAICKSILETPKESSCELEIIAPHVTRASVFKKSRSKMNCFRQQTWEWVGRCDSAVEFTGGKSEKVTLLRL
jgi:hypothetical protein